MSVCCDGHFKTPSLMIYFRKIFRKFLGRPKSIAWSNFVSDKMITFLTFSFYIRVKRWIRRGFFLESAFNHCLMFSFIRVSGWTLNSFSFFCRIRTLLRIQKWPGVEIPRSNRSGSKTTSTQVISQIKMAVPKIYF